MTAGDGPTGPEVGSVGEEAAKLFGALQDWARESGAAQAGGLVDGLAGQLQDVSDHVAHGEDCRYCPLCQAIRIFRQTSPEVRQHLVSAAGSLAQAVTAYVETATRPADGGRPTERIDLDED